MFGFMLTFKALLITKIAYCSTKCLLFFPLENITNLTGNTITSHQAGFQQQQGNQSSVFFIPTTVSINTLLKEGLTNISNGDEHVSWIDSNIFRMVGQLGGNNKEDLFINARLSSQLGNLHEIILPISINCQFVSVLENYRLKRIAIITYQANCKSRNVLDLVRKMNKQNIHSEVFCLHGHVPTQLDFWYALQSAIQIELTTVVLFLTSFDSMRAIDSGEALGMLSESYVWIAFDFNPYELRNLREMYPRFKFSNFLIEQQTDLSSKALRIQAHYDAMKKCSIKRDDSILTDIIEYQLSAQKLHPQIWPAEQKKVLRFVTLLYYPLVFPVKHVLNEAGHCLVGMPCKLPIVIPGGTIWKPLCCTGLIMEILWNVIKDMNIEYDMYIVEDGSFGGFQNGTWTGIMHDVYTGKADVGIHAMSVLHERLDYVDFTLPILGSWFGIIRRDEGPQMKTINWIFLTHLQVDLIIAICVLFLVNFGVAFIFENALRKIIETNRYKIRELFSYLSGILFQRDLGAKHPSFWSSRLPCLSYALAMTVIMSTYTANLTAKNLIYLDNDDFKGLSDPRITNPTNEFKFSVIEKSSYELWARKKPHIYNFVKDRLLSNDVVGVDQVLSGTLDGYIGDWTFLKYLSQLPKFCNKLKLYKETRKSIFSAFVVPKNSSWKEPFSQEILNVFETGVMAGLLNKWLWYAQCEMTQNEFASFPWKYFGGLFVFSSSSIAFAVVLLLVENVVDKIGVRVKGRTSTNLTVVEDSEQYYNDAFGNEEYIMKTDL